MNHFMNQVMEKDFLIERILKRFSCNVIHLTSSRCDSMQILIEICQNLQVCVQGCSCSNANSLNRQSRSFRTRLPPVPTHAASLKNKLIISRHQPLSLQSTGGRIEIYPCAVHQSVDAPAVGRAKVIYSVVIKRCTISFSNHKTRSQPPPQR